MRHPVEGVRAHPGLSEAASGLATRPTSRPTHGGLLWESSYAPDLNRGAAGAEPMHAGGFVAGTRIRTATGEGLVQALRVGDAVVTHSGMRRQIKWIGRRAYSATTMAANPHLRPVLFRVGSMGHDTPREDLRLAPNHMVLIEDAGAGIVLVPAASLVNGVSILREAVSGPVSYLHVELNSHDVIVAEGAPAETFIDNANRVMFLNAAEFAALYPRNPPGDGRPCVKRLEEGHGLAHIRERLAGLAGIDFAPAAASQVRFELERRRGMLEGWAVDEAAPDVPVELDVLLDGQLYMRLPANRYRPDLDHAGIAGGRAGFSCALPARGGHIAIRHAPARVQFRAEAAD